MYLEIISCIIKKEKHEEQIIKYSIKFMRLLNAYIVDRGWEYNKEDRVVFRGIKKLVLKGAQVGETYRLVTLPFININKLKSSHIDII